MRYRGKKPRSGLTAEQAIVVALILIAVVMALTIRVSGQITGMSAGEQLYQAMFVAKDWD